MEREKGRRKRGGREKKEEDEGEIIVQLFNGFS